MCQIQCAIKLYLNGNLWFANVISEFKNMSSNIKDILDERYSRLHRRCLRDWKVRQSVQLPSCDWIRLQY